MKNCRTWKWKLSSSPSTSATKANLQVFMQGESNVYREQDTEAAAKFKGLTSEDMLVYQAI
jgi:hypothetical protein